MQAAFDARLRTLLGLTPPRHVGLAVSGGVDSMALASLAFRWARRVEVNLHAFVVDHGLRSNSDAEASSVVTNLTKIGVPATSLKLHLKGQLNNVETEARHARRDILRQACEKHNCTALLHGHHLDDQHELLLMRLLSHSTWYGLAGMTPLSWLVPELDPDIRREPVRLVKPLLETPKSALRHWCQQNSINWFEDPTNDNSFTKRNLIRKWLQSEDVPPFAKYEQLSDLLKLFGTQRAEVDRQSLMVLLELCASGALVYHTNPEGSATLRIPPGFLQLSGAVKHQVLFMILAQLSPLATDHVFYRRNKVSQLLPLMGSEFMHPSLGVMVKGDSASMFFSRANPTNAASNSYHAFDVGQNWSQWQKFDNRWWLRCKLAQQQQYSENRVMVVRMIRDPEEALAIIRTFFGEPSPEFVRKHRHLLPAQPFLAFSNPHDPLSLDPETVVGFPTLGLTQAAEVECKFQKYLFD